MKPEEKMDSRIVGEPFGTLPAGQKFVIQEFDHEAHHEEQKREHNRARFARDLAIKAGNIQRLRDAK